MLYVEHYLNPAYFPGIERFDLTRSLTDLYANHYGIRYGRVRFEMVPTILPAEAAGPLRVSVGSPALQIVRINRDQAGRLIDCDLEYWRHDALQVNVEVPGSAPRSCSWRMHDRLAGFPPLPAHWSTAGHAASTLSGCR